MIEAVPIDGGPYLTCAVFCEKLLREADGVASIIRAIDKFTVPGMAEQMPMTVLNMTLVVMFKSGVHRGSGILTVTPTTPSGVAMPAIRASVIFEGDNDKGIIASAPIGFPVQEPGEYWFEISVDGTVYTHTAIRVNYLRALTPPGAQEHSA